MSLSIGERPARAAGFLAPQTSQPAAAAPELQPKRDAFIGTRAAAEWAGEPVNPPGLKPYVDRARKIGFNTFLGIGGVSLAGVLGGIVACAFNPPVGLAIIAGSALVNAGAVGTMILLAREDSVADAQRRSAALAEKFAPGSAD